jgi:hypothetical protein
MDASPLAVIFTRLQDNHHNIGHMQPRWNAII